MRTWSAASALLLCGGALLFGGEDPELRAFLNDQKYENGWIYEDLDAGYAEARKTDKPLLVCLCCVP